MCVLSICVGAWDSEFILGCTEVLNFCQHQMSIKGKKTAIWGCCQLTEGEWKKGNMKDRERKIRERYQEVCTNILWANYCICVNFMWRFDFIEMYHLSFAHFVSFWISWNYSPITSQNQVSLRPPPNPAPVIFKEKV